MHAFRDVHAIGRCSHESRLPGLLPYYLILILIVSSLCYNVKSRPGVAGKCVGNRKLQGCRRPSNLPMRAQHNLGQCASDRQITNQGKCEQPRQLDWQQVQLKCNGSPVECQGWPELNPGLGCLLSSWCPQSPLA